ncbi:MAG: DnaA/Hda family protein [Magnetococcus sp. WYHC-3]
MSPCATALQLLLPLPLREDMTFDSWVSDPGTRAVERALAHPAALPHPCLTLYGPPGCGKTHLLQAALSRHRRSQGEQAGLLLTGNDLARLVGQGDETALVTFLHARRTGSLLAVDDMDAICSSSAAQEALLYLHNEFRRAGKHLLLAARHSPAQLPALRADLRSRLLAGLVLELSAPDTHTLERILLKMARDRSIRMDRRVAAFLSQRLPRSVPALAEALTLLDHASLTAARPITIPLAKAALRL